MEKRWQLTSSDVERVVAACKAEAAKKGVRATVAVVDAGGHLMHLERPETDQPLGVDMATLKARTAAMRGRPSSALETRVAERPGFLNMPGTIPVRGGVPLVYQGTLVGGVGVSGVAEHDEPVAEAGAAALDADGGAG